MTHWSNVGFRITCIQAYVVVQNEIVLNQKKCHANISVILDIFSYLDIFKFIKIFAKVVMKTNYEFFIVLMLVNIQPGKSTIDYCDLNCRADVNTVCEMKLHKCQLLPSCPVRTRFGLNLEEERTITHLHNKLRDDFAGGKDKNFKEVKVANMQVLSYSYELAYSAQCHANKCWMERDLCRRTPRFGLVGQSYYRGRALKTPILNINEAINTEWYNDWRNWKSDASHYEFAHNDNRFVQLIWAETTHLGCGRTSFEGLNDIVCNYYTEGCVANESVFTKGEPATKCEEGQKPNNIYTNLCGKQENDIHKFVPPYRVNTAFNLRKTLFNLILWILLLYL